MGRLILLAVKNLHAIFKKTKKKKKKKMRNKVIREKQRCFNCTHNESTSSKTKKLILNLLGFFTSYKTC